jgi:uncharacterized membrane protein
MTQQIDPLISEQIRPWLRRGLWLANGLIALGVVLALVSHEAARDVIMAGLGVLVVIPVFNVVVGLADEVRLRQWKFVAAALAVLIILAVNVLHKW